MRKGIIILISVILATSCVAMRTATYETGVLQDIKKAEGEEGEVISSKETSKKLVEEKPQVVIQIPASKEEETTIDSREVVVVEKPIYVPERKIIEKEKGKEAVIRAAEEATAIPTDYVGQIFTYDYIEEITYQVYTQPLRLTVLQLQAGEAIDGDPILGDTSRWQIGYNVVNTKGVDEQHVYIKPTSAGLTTNMIINTNKRIYHILLMSYSDIYMAAVKWNYYQAALPQKRIKQEVPKKEEKVKIGAIEYDIDKSLISMDYLVKYPTGKNKPSWLPTLVIDDAMKTYIYLPEDVAFQEMPGVYQDNGELLNSRIESNVIIIDRLIKKIELRLGESRVYIWKKGAK